MTSAGNPIEEIRQVLYRYCRGMDRMDRPLATSCFSPSAEVDYVGIHRGTAASFLDFVWDLHSRMVRHSHQIANVLAELDGDRARTEAYVTAVLWPRPNPDPIERTVRGRYLDEWSCRDGRWCIDRRLFVTDVRSVVRLSPDPLGKNPGPSARDRTDPSYEFIRGVRQTPDG